jgi:Domain of unknown function (DUF4180)
VARRILMRIDSPRAISNALATAMEEGGLVLGEADLAPAFYDLTSGLAGELFQKFVNYRVRLALVVKDPAAHGQRFDELAREHRSHTVVRIFPDHDAAAEWLSAARRVE